MTIKPYDCVVAVGIPIHRDEYVGSVDRTEGTCVVQTQRISWPKYEREITEPFLRASRRWRKLGVVIFTQVTLTALSKIFLQHDPKALILFSHSRDDHVELFEGMVPTDDVLGVIPESFSGTVDLCVCHSGALAMKIKEHRRNAIVKFSDNPAMYTIWFGIYTTTFTLIAKGNFEHYVDAIDNALDVMQARR